MQTVEIHIAPTELPEQMAAMRLWLDAHRFESTAFSCDDTPPALRVLVTFAAAGPATAFAARFAGRLLHVKAEPAVERGALSPADLVG